MQRWCRSFYRQLLFHRREADRRHLAAVKACFARESDVSALRALNRDDVQPRDCIRQRRLAYGATPWRCDARIFSQR